MSIRQGVPLFPLNTVLFPGMTMPLHIFEERYRLMIARCLDQGTEFGILLIKDGPETGGGPTEPFDVGTLARITEANQLPDGRINIMTEGTRRFQVIDYSYELPYLSADVELLDDISPEAATGDVLGSREAFEGYVRLLLALAGQWQRSFDLPNDADRLSFSIGTALKVGMPVKQDLLEQPSAARRLAKEREILEVECGRLRKLVAHKWHNSGGSGFPVN